MQNDVCILIHSTPHYAESYAPFFFTPNSLLLNYTLITDVQQIKQGGMNDSGSAAQVEGI